MKIQDRITRLRHDARQMKSGEDLQALLLGLIDVVSDLEHEFVGGSILSNEETEAIFGKSLDPSPDPDKSLDINNWMLHEKND